MADDAAGAVRRTPHPDSGRAWTLGDEAAGTDAGSRPAAPPDLWWSPSMARFLSRHEDQDDEHLVWVWHGHQESLRHYLGTGLDSNPPLPADAVRLVPDGPETRRPVVLLPAEDCTCTPPYADCPHGPEPVDALALAVWLHAESEWFREQKQREIRMLHDQLRRRRAERDGLQAELTWRRLRMDEVLAEIDSYDGPTSPAELPEDSAGTNILTRIRALMQGDQPADDRQQAFTDAAGDPEEERIRDAEAAHVGAEEMADAIADGWDPASDLDDEEPTGEADRG
ncbi:hypothetical protein AB0J55_17630 [Amycolatopsis sp. NPDC049688]|uniref:hypothetical protein n=1 Tax=Amycolatopsis sp. NPDC049688 TaxID=3154733 RepID=UPI003416F212